VANKSDFERTWSYNSYKWQPGSSLAPTALYTFGECLALISFVHHPAPYVVVLQSAPMAQEYRKAFEFAWAAAKDSPASKSRSRR
jgi:hypothetical protein